MTCLYTYSGNQLTGEVITTTVDGTVTGTETLYYSYDASGTPVSVKYNNTLYFYITNLQGDVIAIMNGSGTIVVEYTYDAWGYIRNTSGSMKDTLGKANALRYRGYVYDTETCLYYLQSRYYNPGTGRFINADALVITGQGLLGNNMFAYCRNNPVSRRDISGFTDEDCFDDGTKEELIYRPEGSSIGAQQTSSDGIPTAQVVGSSTGNGGQTYSPPSGGGGISTSVQVGGTTVTFGHGGGHLGGGDISQIESFIANDVITRPPTTGQVSHIVVDYYGSPLNYGYYTRSDTVINVGTYFFEKLDLRG